jgi:hypothetical protein
MAVVSTEKEIEEASIKAIDALFGSSVQDLKIREVFPYSADRIITHSEDMDTESQSKDGWDIQVTFKLDNQQYTVDLIIQERDGRVIYSRLIDKMAL